MILVVGQIASIILALAAPGFVWFRVVREKTGLRPLLSSFGLSLILLTASGAILAFAVISPQVAGANYSQQRLRGIDANVFVCLVAIVLAIRSKHALNMTLVIASAFMLAIWIYLGVVNVAV